MINPTLQQVKDIGIAVGLEPEKSEQWYHYYKAQGWKYPPAPGIEIVDIKSALYRWQCNQYRFEKNEKRKLYPIKDKVCGKLGCKMVAVYKDSTGDYDHYYCADHMPQAMRDKYA